MRRKFSCVSRTHLLNVRSPRTCGRNPTVPCVRRCQIKLECASTPHYTFVPITGCTYRITQGVNTENGTPPRGARCDRGSTFWVSKFVNVGAPYPKIVGTFFFSPRPWDCSSGRTLKVISKPFLFCGDIVKSRSLQGKKVAPLFIVASVLYRLIYTMVVRKIMQPLARSFQRMFWTTGRDCAPIDSFMEIIHEIFPSAVGLWRLSLGGAQE